MHIQNYVSLTGKVHELYFCYLMVFPSATKMQTDSNKASAFADTLIIIDTSQIFDHDANEKNHTCIKSLLPEQSVGFLF